MSQRLIIIGCVKKKRSVPALAKDLYTSDLFAKRRRFAEKSAAPWCIVSARLPGFLSIDEVVEPYDRVMSKLIAAERDEWVEAASGVLPKILDEVALAEDGVIEIHAGAAYVDVVRRVLQRVAPDIAIETPLAGLKFGYQLQWYIRQLGE